MNHLFFLFAALLVWPSLCTAEDKPRPKLKVGVVLGLTGGASTHSGAVRRGIELAADKLQSEGWELELSFEDDQTNPAKSVAAFRSLTTRGYRFFIGPTWSFQVKAVKAVLGQSNAITLIPTSSSVINGGASENVFNLCPRRDLQTPVLTDWLSAQEKVTAVILTATSDWGEVHKNIFMNAVKDSGHRVIDLNEFPYGVDITTAKTLLSKPSAAKANLILTTGAASDVTNILKARNQLKRKAIVVATNDLRDAMEQGLVDSSELLPGDQVLHLPQNKDFAKIYTPKYGHAPLLYADRGYDALVAISKTVEEVGYDIERAKKHLSSTIDYQGVTGRIRFDSSGDLIDGFYLIGKAQDPL